MQQLKEQFEENLETWWSIEYYSTKKMSPQLQPFPGASECLIYERDTPPPWKTTDKKTPTNNNKKKRCFSLVLRSRKNSRVRVTLLPFTGWLVLPLP